VPVIPFYARIPKYRDGYVLRRRRNKATLICCNTEGSVDRKQFHGEYFPDELFTFYDPFEDTPALFRNFAHLGRQDLRACKASDDDHDNYQDVLNFVNESGVSDLSPLLSEEEETAASYRARSTQLLAAMRLHELLQRGDKQRIEKFFYWDRQYNRWDASEPHVLNFSGNYVPEELMRDPKAYVLDLGQNLLDGTIHEETSAGKSKVSRTYENKQSRVLVRLAFPDFFSAVWMQFALSLMEGKRYRMCETCGKEFEESAGVNRSHQEFCSNKCRVKAFRRRQKEAMQLHAKGVKLRDIAKRVGSTVETIKGWIAQQQ
jgi:hypothetical protein